MLQPAGCSSTGRAQRATRWPQGLQQVGLRGTSGLVPGAMGESVKPASKSIEKVRYWLVVWNMAGL